jgi:hypothetical protein
MGKYVNRYGDEFVFEMDENGDIIWTGNFEYVRIGFPNDYTKAFMAYLKDREDVDEDEKLTFEEFKHDVHVHENGVYLYPEYVRMVESVRDKISMADPSGGPYICVGMPLTDFGFKGLVVKDIKPLDSGYKIIVEK